MKYLKEDIRKIVEGGVKSRNYYENISNSFVELQIAILNNKDINIVAFEFTGDVIMAVRQLRQFGKEPKSIIVYKFDNNNPFYRAILHMNCDCKIVTFESFKNNLLKKKLDEVYIALYYSKINIVDIKTLLFKVRRKLAQRNKNYVLSNPVCKELTKNTIEFAMCSVDKNNYDYMLYYLEHIKELEMIYDMLEDQKSKNIFVEIIRTKCESDRYREDEGMPENKYWECYKHLDNEKWVNCGSCFGDTINWFLYNNYSFDYIDAYEGDTGTFETLRENIKQLDKSNINLLNQYIGFENEENNFDDLYADRDVTLINMDIEGAETKVLNGARKIIKEKKPVLAICAYHKPSDIVEIPMIIKSISDDYSFYLRKYPSSSPKRVTEYVYYMVPYERMV